MSIPFNDTSNLKGSVQFYEKEIGVNYGSVSANTTKLKEFTAEANIALDDFFAIALPASGMWQLDDSNQTDYPIITTNLVSGQRDYPFTTDELGNLVLDIFRVFIKPDASTSVYQEIFPIDQQSDPGTEGFTDGQNLTGTPYRYDKTGNALFLDPIPSYNATNGLKVYINREASYFATTDTTKKPGVPGLFHKYFYLKPALSYFRINNQQKYQVLLGEVLKLEKDIKDYFGRRERDIPRRITNQPIRFM